MILLGPSRSLQGFAQFLFGDVGLDLQIRQLVSQPLRLDSKAFSLLFARPHFVFQQNTSFEGLVIL
jgi:hypothetical protein